MCDSKIKIKFYAVASNIDKIKKYPYLLILEWKGMKSKCNFVNMRQVHFDNKKQAQDLYDKILELNIIAFKNWT